MYDIKFRRVLLPLLALAAAALGLFGCGSNKGGKVVSNQDPHVKITGGPLEGTKQSYTARVYWSGWDYDGIVDHYEYAVDPPDVFTPAEVARPDSFPSINIRVIPGPTSKEDTLVVSKTVDGRKYSFEWIKTPEFSRSFAFETPDADTVYQGSKAVPDKRFSGYHTIYVRCVDDDGAVSALDKLGYTAMTLTPSSEINVPKISDNVLNVGTTVTIGWDGLDPDSPDPKKKPVAYMYNLLQLDSIDPPPRLYSVQPSILYQYGTWKRQEADTLKKTFFLVSSGHYVFGVRAVDVAGAEEPFLEFGRNAFKMQSLANAGYPALSLSEPSLGSFEFSGVGLTFEREVPVGAKLRFNWSASAEGYGGTIDGYSWGLDIPDIERDGPGSGWSAWGLTTGNFQPIIFTKPGVHVFYVRARDTSGAMTVGAVILNVLDFPLDREVLWVDDAVNGAWPEPTDEQVDAFWTKLLQDSGRFAENEIFNFQVYGDRDKLNPAFVPLEEMGRYKLLVWDNTGSGQGGYSALHYNTGSKNKFLGAYLSSGGQLWLSGTQTIAAAMYPNSAIPLYNTTLTPGQGDFAFDFLKIQGDVEVHNDRAASANNNLVSVGLFSKIVDGQKVPNEIYPAMQADPAKLNPFAGGVPYCDAVWNQIYDNIFVGELDSLYTFGAKKANSSWNSNRIAGLRWHDPNPSPLQGRTQWFGFPMYYFYKDQAQETFNRSIDWFREEQTPALAP